MKDSDFLLYGSYGFVGREIARRAVQSGLRPLLAGRHAEKLQSQAEQLELEYRVFALEETRALEKALSEFPAVLNCAGPYLHTFQPVVEACLRTATHYLDITGEIPVYEAIAARDAQARQAGVMLLPGVGFDVVPTDCLARHLQGRLPSAAHLTLAFQTQGPAGLPPGTRRTMREWASYGTRARRQGEIVPLEAPQPRQIDFGDGPVKAYPLSWGDIFTAYYSTGIPNIEEYAAFSQGSMRRQSEQGSTPEERAQTVTHVWGEARNDQGQAVRARLHGPEPGVDWTAGCALAVLRKALSGEAPPGFQTPAKAYGPNLVLETGDVRREDLDGSAGEGE